MIGGAGAGYGRVMADRAVGERRSTPRAPAHLTVQLERLGAGGHTGTAHTRDLSERGARLVGPDAFGVGDVVLVTINSGEVPLAVQGLVVGSKPHLGRDAMLNVAFKTLSDEDRAKLRKLVDLR